VRTRPDIRGGTIPPAARYRFGSRGGWDGFSTDAKPNTRAFLFLQGVATGTQLISLEGADISLHPGFAFAISLPRGTILDHLPHLQTLVDWTCHVVEDSATKPPTNPDNGASEERERLRALLIKILSELLLPFETEVMASKCLDLYDSLAHSTAVYLTGGAGSGKSSCWKLLAKALSSEDGGLNGIYSRGAEEGFNRGGKEAVNVRVLYPGALTREELLGAYGQNHQVGSL
jgi:hypothetical protein